MRKDFESHVVSNHNKVGFIGLLITLGIVFGDIGTSPLYVMKAFLIQAKTSTRAPYWAHYPASSGHSPYRPPSNMYAWLCEPTTMAKEAFSPFTPCCADSRASGFTYWLLSVPAPCWPTESSPQPLRLPQPSKGSKASVPTYLSSQLRLASSPSSSSCSALAPKA